MIGNVFAQHVALIRDYPGAPPAPPPPPPPPPSPQPPDDAIAFSAIAQPALYGVVGTAIPSTTMATVTCADASMTLRVEPAVPGLTWAYAAGLLTVSGTPTTQGQWRVNVSFVATSGVIRGATAHLVTIEDFSIPFDVGTMLNPVVRIGQTVNLTLCSPTTAKNVDVFASPNATIPVEVPNGNPVNGIAFTWTAGATSSGTLKLQGTIASTAVVGTTTLTVTYKRKGQQQTVYGTSTHTVTVAPRFEDPPPPPPPAPPPPPPPAPPPPPPPPPAPVPPRGADPFFSSVLSLLHTDFLATGIGYDPATGPPGVNVSVPGKLFTMRYIETDGRGGAMGYFGLAPYSNQVGLAGYYNAAASLVHPQSEMSGIVDRLSMGVELTAECFVRMNQATWDALVAGGTTTTEYRYVPVLSALDPAGNLLWTLGFGSWVVGYAFNNSQTRKVLPLMLSALNAPNSPPVFNGMTMQSIGPALLERSDRYIHLCGERTEKPGAMVFQGTWFDRRAENSGLAAKAKVKTATSATLKVGGTIPAVQQEVSGQPWVMLRFFGEVDEARVTAAAREPSAIGTSMQPLPSARITIPWPNF